MPVNVKICGLRRREDIDAVNALKPDYAGFVFHAASRRNLSHEDGVRLLSQLDHKIKSVAVCVSPDREKLFLLEGMGFDIIQIHGELPIETIEECDASIWQAVNISGPDDLKNLISHPKITGYVVDSAVWGSGKTFGWEDDETEAHNLSQLLRKAVGDKTFILAGGLSPDNVSVGISLMHPDIVDVSSGVETGGYKDFDLIKEFILNARTAK